MSNATVTRLLPAILLALAMSAGVAAADPIRFARHPHVAHGKIAFSYHGDIWVANQDGTSPLRLTAHVARDTFPRFSPDGTMIAFTSNRMGNNDVWVVPAAGGEPRQLTFNTTNDTVLYWTPDGRRIVFSTSRGSNPWLTPLYTVSVDGGLPMPMEMDQGETGMIRQDGSLVAFTRMGGAYWRKGSRGNRTDDIWVQDLKTKRIRQLTDPDLKQFRDHVQDVYPMWGADGQIYFASERSEIFNIWRIAPAGGAPVQVTRHTEDGIQFPSISPDGRTIAYENDFDLWTLDVPSGTPRRVAIEMRFDSRDNLVTWDRVRNRAQNFSPSPEGDYLVVDQRGELFVVPTDSEVGEKTQVTSSAWRDHGGLFSPDGRYIAHLSDETKEQEVWLFDRTARTRRRLSAHESFKDLAAWSPDSTTLAWIAANRLFTAPVGGGAAVEVAHNEAGGYQAVEFSPDGKWLVYTRRDDDMNSDVFVYDLAGKREHNVTDNPFTDRNGVITPDAKHVVFLSDRDGGTTHLFVVPLQRLREDPDDPLVRERLKKAAASSSSGRQGGGGTQTEKPPAPALAVETEGIGRRAVQLTTGTQGVQNFFLSADGRTIYFRATDERGPGLFSITIEGKDRRRVSEGAFAGLTPTHDRRKVFYTENGDIHQMEMTGQNRKSRVTFDLAVRVDQRAEWAQIFDEAWRVMKYRFYDEQMHGRD